MAIITDGLVHEYVGKKNEHTTYNSSASTWHDLVGSSDLTLNVPANGAWQGAGTVESPYAHHCNGGNTVNASAWWSATYDATWALGTAFSVELWLYWDGTAAYNQSMFRHRGSTSGFHIYGSNATTYFTWAVYGNATWNYANFGDVGDFTATWRHLCITYDSGTWRAYRDGIDPSKSLSVNATADTTNPQISADGGTIAQSMHGSYAALRWYSKALSLSEYQENYNSGILAASTDVAPGFSGLTVTRTLAG